MAHINEQPPALPNTVPEPVAALVLSCIAKKPADRPATAANLARAAQALRRGDVAAATVAVPAIGGAGTVAFNPPPGDDAATALLRTQANAPVVGGAVPGTPAGPEQDEEPEKRRAWIWWVVAAVVLVAAIVVGAIVFANQQSRPVASSSPSPTASSAPPEPSQTPTDTRQVVDPNDYVGTPTTEASARLAQLGFEVRIQDGDPAESADKANTVQSMSPTGSLSAGTLITLREFTAPPTVNKPNTPTAGAVSTDGAVTFSWTSATCPTGYTVSKYSWTVSGGKSASGATSGDTTETSVQIQADQVGTDVSFSYTVTCGNLAASAGSDPATATWVQPVQPTGTPTPGEPTGTPTGPQD
jgi:serine/threonine-protein kinase